MSKELFEKKPRWIGAPKICIYENRPAFKTEKEMKAFQDANNPSGSMLLKWECGICKHWHYQAAVPAPAGSSSGNARAFTPAEPQFRQDCPHPMNKTITQRNEKEKQAERTCGLCGKLLQVTKDEQPPQKRFGRA